METVALSEARVYVSTYSKCNNGSLFGKWLDLSDYSDMDEFLEACRELHKDDRNPEFMLQGYKNIPEALISESQFSEKFFELRDAIEKLSEARQEMFFVQCDHHNSGTSKEDADDLTSPLEGEYQGEYEDEGSYAYEIVGQYYDLPELAKTYFDYSASARDLFITGYWMDNGFVFRCA